MSTLSWGEYSIDCLFNGVMNFVLFLLSSLETICFHLFLKKIEKKKKKLFGLQ